MSKEQTEDIQYGRGRQLSVIEEEGIVVWKIVSKVRHATHVVQSYVAYNCLSVFPMVVFTLDVKLWDTYPPQSSYHFQDHWAGNFSGHSLDDLCPIWTPTFVFSSTEACLLPTTVLHITLTPVT
ncbi:hypothetical protein E2C01_051164 [Portunus trituberculatus]|uniref:Uncharacterized protein n=1 Tax=Portunus trituberculatus TaxID=210409 RepID=A0A5B7GHY9_PORTR|nr:hypothetical protein [Portunus trituberculatus]